MFYFLRPSAFALLLVLFLGVGFSFSAAQAEDAPLEITADQDLEWNQTAKSYTARGNAVAKQSDFSVAGQLLIAEYAGVDGSTSDLIKVTAEGKVVILSSSVEAQSDRAEGERAVYDIANQVVVLTGSPSSKPMVSRGKDTLVANEIKVFLENAVMKRAEAYGSVVISTDGEQKASGDKATFDKASNIAELIGNVKIMQGFNWIEGDYAKMNLTTKVSTISGKKNRPRVKGIFYPSSGKKK
ncbi:MAG TPA: LptA/OstA family protein [Alphaproteobacteria bacterium]|nr:hypothetical protein [Alphaproteobacteria bacterium]HOO50386.1 LptA/OstA family protein [Alphaproteobacteria bacterium]